MSPTNNIVKVGLAVTVANRLLLVRKRGAVSYILPGGKPECGEDDLQTLRREIWEELRCKIASGTLAYLGTFSDEAADLVNMRVTIKLYAAELIGSPCPHAEIENIRWFDPCLDGYINLAPSLNNRVLPFLVSHGRLAGGLLRYNSSR